MRIHGEIEIGQGLISSLGPGRFWCCFLWKRDGGKTLRNLRRDLREAMLSTEI